MSYYVGLPLLLLAALVEATVLPMFPIGGLQPNLTLVLMVAWLMVRGANEAYQLIPFGGLCLGLVDGAPMGTALIALAPIALLDEVRGSRLRETGLLLTVSFTVIATLIFYLVYLFVFSLFGQAGSWQSAFVQVAVPTCLLNVAVLLPIYFVLQAASQEQRRAAYP